MTLSHPTIATIARRTAVFLAATCVQSTLPAAESKTGPWRCGNSYSDQPCHGGKALDLDDPRGAAQKQEADRTTREAQLAADRMERDRLQLESTLGRRHATIIDNQKPRMASTSSSPGSVRKKKGEGKAAHFGALDPGSPGSPKPKASRKTKPRRKTAES